MSCCEPASSRKQEAVRANVIPRVVFKSHSIVCARELLPKEIRSAQMRRASYRASKNPVYRTVTSSGIRTASCAKSDVSSGSHPIWHPELPDENPDGPTRIEPVRGRSIAVGGDAGGVDDSRLRSRKEATVSAQAQPAGQTLRGHQTLRRSTSESKRCENNPPRPNPNPNCS